MKISLLSATCCALIASTSVASATNLVSNGGFENGSGDWSNFGNTNTTYNFLNGSNAYEGSYDWANGNFPAQGLAGLSQKITTTSGDGYDISLYWLADASNGPTDQQYQVLWDGAVVGNITGAPASTSYTNLVYHVTGTGSDTLAFQGFSAHGYNLTDDVSVVANGLTSGVPEPATWAMMLLGFGLIGFAMRKRANARTKVSYA